ncbi:MAG: FHA domain-containing protein [Blastochloris sp.]|nr:FHA domain-containing protein [Blastochloris sp.]
MAYSTIDILQSLAHARADSHLYFAVSGFKAELWIQKGQLRRIVASESSALMEYLTLTLPTIVLQPLYSETFLEHTKETVDLNELALLAAQQADAKAEDVATAKIGGTKKKRATMTPKILYSEVFFSVAIPLICNQTPNERLIIGRDVRNCAIAVDDTRVSREHCCVVRKDENKYRVIDLNSTNGTYVNGCRMTMAEAQAGDFLRVGDHVFALS